MNFETTVQPAADATPAKAGCPRPAKGARRGSAVLVVLVLLACLALFIMANASALHALKQELKLIDQQQLKKYGDGGGAKK